jgi:hypothetical protein
MTGLCFFLRKRIAHRSNKREFVTVIDFAVESVRPTQPLRVRPNAAISAQRALAQKLLQRSRPRYGRQL